MKAFLVVGFMINLLASCVPNVPVTPPDAALPGTYRGSADPATSLAATPWQEIYDDPVLRILIAEALANNLSVAAAYQTILAAQANVEINHGKQQLQVNGEFEAPLTVSAGTSPLTVVENGRAQPEHTIFRPDLGVGVSYELDVFGRLASATSAARAQLLASVEGRNAISWQLVASVAGDYFTLRELDAELDISNQTLLARKQSLELVRARYTGGIASLLDVRQAEESYFQVSATIPQVQRSIGQTEDAISALTGGYPHDILRGFPLETQVKLPVLPSTGIPSELLRRRPDILQAEATLAAASANVDVARKLLYPQITLTAEAGAGYTAINSIFYGPEGLLSVIPKVIAPIFNGGAIKANIRLTQAQRQQAAISYLQAVQTAMVNVADAVTSYDHLRDAVTQSDLRAAAALDSTRLANLRYEGGVSSYSEVLDAQTRSYQDEISAVQAQLNVRLALVQLYLALGGGWSSGAN
jgi:outer membrane protein, multidrug efflux system